MDPSFYFLPYLPFPLPTFYYFPKRPYTSSFPSSDHSHLFTFSPFFLPSLLPRRFYLYCCGMLVRFYIIPYLHFFYPFLRFCISDNIINYRLSPASSIRPLSFIFFHPFVKNFSSRFFYLFQHDSSFSINFFVF